MLSGRFFSPECGTDSMKSCKNNFYCRMIVLKSMFMAQKLSLRLWRRLLGLDVLISRGKMGNRNCSHFRGSKHE